VKAGNRQAGSPVAPRRYARGFLVLILSLAAFLRFNQLGAVPHGLHNDEAMEGSSALQVLETGRFQPFYPENNGREGLYVDLTVVSVSLFGNSEFAVRLPAAILGVLTVWGIYSLAGELWSTPVGLLSAFFLATSFWHLNFSRLGLRTIAAPFFLVWALFFLVVALRRLLAGQPERGLMLLAGAVYGLGFHTYIAYRVTPVLVGVILLWAFIQARGAGKLAAFWKSVAAFAAVAAVVAAPLLVYFAQHPGTFSGRTSQVLVHSAGDILGNTWKTAQMFFFSGDPNWRHNYDGDRELFWPVAILFAIGIGSALRDLVGRKPAAFASAIALLWLALGALPTIFSDSAPHALRALMMTPAVFMLVACGAMRAWTFADATFGRKAAMGIAGLFCAIAAWQPYHTYFDLWAPNPIVSRNFTGNLVDFAHSVSALGPGAPVYIAATYTGDTANGTPVLLQPFVYLTGSVTAKQQAATNIHYVLPETSRAAAGLEGRTFCDQVKASLPQARVLCVNLRSSP
jgi:4-amino-4-deoxy-L-arabinose transferase-like glycosyltransferase